ncbi:hypothetical protein [Algoriphagus winogradskyi]|uniref:Uncharacterized protein n=1 Tax=Algoriphagus winogradskyi TaxID=237017 RepID=A0ABY1NFI7_9BACT|nr:hypothetical protein [Algoriphagus winogradskyi]SMP08316.1 hypothetical protein SAMN06265367_101734 [Algoriphagus winogradskyi]|tara:strand:- start:10172 stop:10618 length:447 start_codon:yes stop_codon:yes gene_type:complete
MIQLPGNTNFLFIKYLLITGTVAIITIVLLILIMVGTIGESSSGLAIGFAIEPMQIFMICLLIFCSLAIAYFIGPHAAQAISQGRNGVFIGVKCLLVCWTVPCLLIMFFASVSDLSLSGLIRIVITALAPALVFGPIIGLAMRKELER